ncbi:MAG: hypothetical protein WAU07_03205 [Microgenomates group bacterium]
MIKASTQSKARSRLKTAHTDHSSISNTGIISKNPPQQSRILRYMKHIPLLALSVPGFAVCYWMIHTFFPEDIAHLLIPNAFLVFQIPFFISNVFLWSYVFLNTRQGIAMSVMVSILLFLRLQQVVLELFWLIPLIILGVFVLILLKNNATPQSG